MRVPGHHPGAGEQLLERSGQMDALSNALSQVRESGHGQLVVVSGEAGIGKTALLRGFVDRLHEPVAVLWAACDPVIIPCPLGPLLDLNAWPDDMFGDHLAAGARPYDVATVLLRELRRRGPTMLVIEDLHWSDEATLDVIRLIAPRLVSMPLLLVISYRDDELPRAHALQQLLGDLAGRTSLVRVSPERLSRAAVTALAVPLAVNPHRLYQHTGGNPFFVTEVLASGKGRVPATIRDAVLARCGRLSVGARRLLDAVAVVPGRAEVWLLEALAPDAVGALDECLDAGVLVDNDGAVLFRHDLARQVVEESIPPDRRLLLHRGALVALARPPIGRVEPARLSFHAEAAVDAGAVLRFAPAAGERAAAAGAHRQARAEYSRALRFADQAAPPQRADLLEAFARESYMTGAMEQAATALFDALEIRRDSGDLTGQGNCLCLLAQVLGALGRYGDAGSAGQEAIACFEELPAEAGLAHAYGILSGVSGLTDDDEGLRLGLIASSLAEEVGDTRTLVHVLNNVGTIELRRGSPEGLQKLERSRRLAESSGDELAVGRAYMHIALVLVHGRDCLTAEGYVRAGIDYCVDHGLEAWRYGLTALQADCELTRGRWSDAETISNTVLRTSVREGAPHRCLALIVLAKARARRGDKTVGPLLDEAAELTKVGGAIGLVIAVAVARAEIAWLDGRRPEDDDADILHGLSARLHPWHAYQLVCWRQRAGLPTAVPDGLPEPYRSQMTGNHLDAAKWWQEHGCPYEAALSRCDSGDPAALRQALEELRRLGARPAAAIVARRLRDGGEQHLPRGPRPVTAANPAGLTARQIEVLALLAAGLANRDIADRLVVSVRTVDHHVAAILRKLGVHDRSRAGAVAIQLGIAPPV